MINVVLDNGYFTGMACKVGKFENGIDVETLPNEVDPIKQKAYRLENNSWVFDENKYQELLIEENVRKSKELTMQYEDMIVNEIRKKYSVNQELAILRQRDTKLDEYQEYFDYAEQCKLKAKQFFNMV